MITHVSQLPPIDPDQPCAGAIKTAASWIVTSDLVIVDHPDGRQLAFSMADAWDLTGHGKTLACVLDPPRAPASED